MPRFLDYNRTVIGFHGTRRETALRIVTGETTFKPSKNSDDWLGHGVYFWEHAPQQALAWAKQRYASGPIAVLGAMIRLGSCFDLLDPAQSRRLQDLHGEMVKGYGNAGLALPRNRNASKHLDCAALQFAYQAIEEQDGGPVDTCRAVYVPTGKGARLWTRSWLSAQAHIQLCVRSPECIMGVWLAPVEAS